jgi:hypothetical protein
MVFARTICILLFIIPLCRAAELSTFDGKKSTGDLVAANTKEVVFKSNGAIETREPNAVSAIEYNPISDTGGQAVHWIEVQLIDGSQFHCSDVKISGKKVVLTLLANKAKEVPVEVTVELAALFYMIRDYHDPKIASQFRTMLAKRSKRDVYIFTVNDALDRFDGTFGEADEKGESIEFEGEDGSKNPIAMKRIMGMILNPPPRQLGLTLCKVIDINKNELYAKSITVSGGKIIVTTTADVKVEYPTSAGISKMDFSVGSVSYLSNVQPKKVGGATPQFSKDALIDGPGLKIREQKYAKGLEIWAGTVLTYDIEGKYKTFEGVVGTDDQASGSDELLDVSVMVTIEGDNKVLFQQKVQKREAGRNFNLNVVGVKQLKITVESDNVFTSQVDLADAKLRK